MYFTPDPNKWIETVDKSNPSKRASQQAQNDFIEELQRSQIDVQHHFDFKYQTVFHNNGAANHTIPSTLPVPVGLDCAIASNLIAKSFKDYTDIMLLTDDDDYIYPVEFVSKKKTFWLVGFGPSQQASCPKLLGQTGGRYRNLLEHKLDILPLPDAPFVGEIYLDFTRPMPSAHEIKEAFSIEGELNGVIVEKQPGNRAVIQFANEGLNANARRKLDNGNFKVGTSTATIASPKQTISVIRLVFEPYVPTENEIKEVFSQYGELNGVIIEKPPSRRACIQFALYNASKPMYEKLKSGLVIRIGTSSAKLALRSQGRAANDRNTPPPPLIRPVGANTPPTPRAGARTPPTPPAGARTPPTPPAGTRTPPIPPAQPPATSTFWPGPATGGNPIPPPLLPPFPPPQLIQPVPPAGLPPFPIGPNGFPLPPSAILGLLKVGQPSAKPVAPQVHVGHPPVGFHQQFQQHTNPAQPAHALYVSFTTTTPLINDIKKAFQQVRSANIIPNKKVVDSWREQKDNCITLIAHLRAQPNHQCSLSSILTTSNDPNKKRISIFPTSMSRCEFLRWTKGLKQFTCIEDGGDFKILLNDAAAQGPQVHARLQKWVNHYENLPEYPAAEIHFETKEAAQTALTRLTTGNVKVGFQYAFLSGLPQPRPVLPPNDPVRFPPPTVPVSTGATSTAVSSANAAPYLLPLSSDPFPQTAISDASIQNQPPPDIPLPSVDDGEEEEENEEDSQINDVVDPPSDPNANSCILM